MVEYTIFITCNGGKTYNIRIYNDIFVAKHDLYNMVDLEKRRNRPYYVYNDFFENEYPASLNCKIFCLKERVVSNWEKYLDKCNNKMALDNNLNNIYEFPKRFEIFS